VLPKEASLTPTSQQAQRLHQLESGTTTEAALAFFVSSAANTLSCANHSKTLAMSMGKPRQWISDGQIFYVIFFGRMSAS
jgi:hypothetical protein